MRTKRGEISTKFLVGIIILIVSFTIILALIARLNLGEVTRKQICHNSVVLRSTRKVFSGNLDCSTTYVCISGGEDCEKFSSTVTVKVDPANKPEVLRAVADELADCWWMFGEGKLDYMGVKVSPLPETACAVCSIVKFDTKLQETYAEGIPYEEFCRFMQYTQRTEGSQQSYLQYIYGVNTCEELQQEFGFAARHFIDRDIISFSQKHTILTGIRKKIIWGGESFIRPDILGDFGLLGCDSAITYA